MMNAFQPLILSLFLLMISVSRGNAQDMGFENWEDPRLKAYVLETPEEVEQEVGTLHAYLSKGITEPAIQVRSFFLWITHNIQYDTEAALVLNENAKVSGIPQVLKNKKTICTGYARLMRDLCQRSGIPCQTIDGYTKEFTSSQAEMKQADHTWNAVKIKEQWQLLDVTWAASIHQNPKGFPNKNLDYYYLNTASKMLEDHLPADPMWQLLDCPISVQEFQEESESIASLLKEKEPCYYLLDSLKNYEQLSKEQQRVKSLERAYHFNPSKVNGIQLGQIFLDRFIEKAEEEENLQLSGDMDALLQLYPELFALAKKAKKYTTLYDWQKENLAYAYINFGVALSRKLDAAGTDQVAKKMLRDMENSFIQAQSILQELRPTSRVTHGLHSCEQYLSFTRENLKTTDF